MSTPAPVIKRLDHLGIIAAFCHEVRLPRMIDSIIPKHSEHTVSHGDAFRAMILNGLGFHSRTLHMFPGFFQHKPIERLIGPGIDAEHLNDDVLDMEALLSTDKAQQKVERGFRFLKSPEFLTSSLYLKKPERIEALLMVMTCSLMVYAALEHKIRTGLKQNAAFYPDLKNQQTQSPTARWVFLTFEGINAFEFQGHRMVTGMQPYQNALLKILGQLYESFYS
ncbi:IS1634 family transposase [Photorhabdus temperata]|uniref:Transposase n=1 Tax=Photorhabdus temperata subsp. temperata Meg1 TaxID=1393735 RepID=A0A081RY46_PHOTE|nr:IS1634 family transposase [Photorhabdus temperata]KER03599.1 transposase [Photorhabdus temperata subsp. temperata Meg1]MCT8348835.1 IS1634 family transposase [Photorhabdus temperata]